MLAAFAILTIVAIVLFVFALCAAASDADDRLDEMAAIRHALENPSPVGRHSAAINPGGSDDPTDSAARDSHNAGSASRGERSGKLELDEECARDGGTSGRLTAKETRDAPQYD